VLGYFGSDEAARRLTPELRRWPGDGLSARAALGLEVLGLIGTDVALMHLHGIAQKLRFKALQDKAQAKIESIAEARGLSVEELADRLVPHLDLESDGTRRLDFGSRSFRVRFDEHLRPLLLDEEGKPMRDLPSPSKQDDGEKATAAVEAWKALKKDIKTVAATQLERLEQALARRRRWTPEVFHSLLVQHPLLGQLVRRLLWGVYREGSLMAVFRVAEDLSYADLSDQPYQPGAEVEVGLVHPLETDLKAWRQIISDYAILQPFPQVERPVYRAPAPDYKNKVAAPGRILRLEKRGWHRGEVESGCLLEFTRTLAQGRASLELVDGGYLEELARNEVTLGKLTLPDPCDPVDLSEVVADIEFVLG